MDWHKRFLQQAGWTRELRSYLLERAGLTQARRVLEVGCGTGAILADIRVPGVLLGLDLDLERLNEARVHAPGAALTCGNGERLPFGSGTMDITFCHYLLLWVHDPLQVLMEMKRVTRKGGAVLAMAEPDYSARLDEPAPLAWLGRQQTESLRTQGADPSIGSRIGALFSRARIQILETGTMQRSGIQDLSLEEWELEWTVLEEDLHGRVSQKKLRELRTLDKEARKQGKRVLHVPTYFVHGVV